mmetsp:Transcript_49714/g.153625  ORF Transcript_49714/g.153625 Transcript_49714/m.153625 type:complete len:235 (-) Transcript_49714:358-1062(-)|eukprot:CAMPEP_0174853188 /NCGR_PEP_ID=MMETSP1114-20130205/27422_1 /TAXON_ID=312471 /ORGANISM="Neobodo designis, Strain CCAP 1951/1" /LENGTH=234 /DNA_ID=CAMNT_0016087809 /DNA_START=118 /DNA_END=822 /DNA_ORIENTATION=+
MSDATGSSNNVAVQRLQKELMDLMGGSCPDGVTAFPHDDDLFKWDATLVGPPETYYDGIEYRLSIEFTNEYPFVAPKVRFLTPCYHPNVSVSGAICLDILTTEAWSAVMSVSSVLLSLQALLQTPNNNSPLNEAAAKQWHRVDFMRAEARRVAGLSVPEATAAAAAAAASSATAAASAAQATPSRPLPPVATASTNEAPASGQSPQEQRSRSHRHETVAGAQTQPPMPAVTASP